MTAKPLPEEKNGSPISGAGNEETRETAEVQITEHDLKILSLEYIGDDSTGRCYFLIHGGKKTIAIGNRANLSEYRQLRQLHPMIDWDTAGAVLKARQATVKTYGALDNSDYALKAAFGDIEDIIDSEEVQHRARLLKEPCAAVIAREAQT